MRANSLGQFGGKSAVCCNSIESIVLEFMMLDAVFKLSSYDLSGGRFSTLIRNEILALSAHAIFARNAWNPII